MTVPGDLRGTFREEMEFATAAARTSQAENYQGALKFADAGIKALFGLNGGGLVALPAFLALFKADVRAAAGWVLASAALFVIGLIAASLTTLLGYLSAMAAVESAWEQLNRTGAEYARAYQQAVRPVTDEELAGMQQAIDRQHRLSIRLRTGAVVCAVIGLVTFVIAAVLSGRVLLLDPSSGP
jgi:hypothetical protein